MTENQINYQKHVESARANRAQEELTRNRDAETLRSNQERERLQGEQNEETRRANLAREGETNRSNLARELETNRSNLANERLKHEATESSLAGQMYAADQNYASRTDAAYINRYGVSKSDAMAAGKAIGGAIDQIVNSPEFVAPGAKAVAVGMKLLKDPFIPQKVAITNLGQSFKQLSSSSSSGKGGHRHE